MRFSRKAKIGAAGVVVSLGLAAGAFAFWTQGGTGTGSASTGTTAGITVNQIGSPTGLYPGGAAAPLHGDFTNPNTSPVNITSVTAAVTATTSAGDVSKPACTTADYAIGGSSGPYTAVVTGTTWSGLNVTLLNGAGNQDNCKNATITITYTANA